METRRSCANSEEERCWLCGAASGRILASLIQGARRHLPSVYIQHLHSDCRCLRPIQRKVRRTCCTFERAHNHKACVQLRRTRRQPDEAIKRDATQSGRACVLWMHGGAGREATQGAESRCPTYYHAAKGLESCTAGAAEGQLPWLLCEVAASILKKKERRKRQEDERRRGEEGSGDRVRRLALAGPSRPGRQARHAASYPTMGDSLLLCVGQGHIITAATAGCPVLADLSGLVPGKEYNVLYMYIHAAHLCKYS